MANEVMELEILMPVSEVTFESKTFPIYGTFEEPMFCAKDVARWIEYDISSINKMLKNVDEEEKARKLVPTLSGAQDTWMLTEQGVYEVLFASRKPIAKEFKKVVKTHMKELRTQGITIQSNLPLPQQMGILINKMDDVLNQQEEEFARLDEQIQLLTVESEQMKSHIEEAEGEIQSLSPKAKKYQAFLTDKSHMSIDDFARITHNRYNLGRNSMFKFMRGKNMIKQKDSLRNIPHPTLVSKGILVHTKGQVFITHKGFDFLCNALDRYYNI